MKASEGRACKKQNHKKTKKEKKKKTYREERTDAAPAPAAAGTFAFAARRPTAHTEEK